MGRAAPGGWGGLYLWISILIIFLNFYRYYYSLCFYFIICFKFQQNHTINEEFDFFERGGGGGGGRGGEYE